jgi:mono/diheme cytochrome c family protein
MPGFPHKQHQEAAMLKPLLIVPALFLAGAPVFFQQTPSSPPAPSTPPAQAAAPAVQSQSGIPAEYVSMANPVKPTPESQERAKKQYGWDCAMCHGENGNGKGDVAAEQKLTIRDYRDPATLKNMSDGEIFYIIKNGKGQMPGDGDRTKTDEVWNLVIYIRHLANTQVTATAAQPPA